MKLVIANDHAAVDMKFEVMSHLEERGIEVVNIGTDTHDSCDYPVFGYEAARLVAEGKVVGACWVRTTDEYGHIDDVTPSFSISLYRPHRGHGIGTAMMRAMLDELREEGYARASLSVQKENPPCNSVPIRVR